MYIYVYIYTYMYIYMCVYIYICICIYIYTCPSLLIFPPISLSIPPPLGCHSTCFEFLASYGKSPLAIYFSYGNVYVSMPLSHAILSNYPTFSPLHCIQNSVLYVCNLCCCPVGRFISTIFLDSIHMR